MPKHCYIRPNRSHTRHFNEKAAGRVVAYARRDGANDALLWAYILQAFGLRRIGCVIFRVLDVMNTTFFLAALVGLFKGLATLAKGLKLIVGGTKSKIITTVLEVVVPKKWTRELGVWFAWLGAVEAICSAVIIFLTAIGNNFAVYLLASRICTAETDAYTVDVETLDIGDLADVLDNLAVALRQPSEVEQPE